MTRLAFGVHSAVPSSISGCVEVIGRCYAGPVPLRAVFSRVEPATDGADKPIRLELQSIEAYGQSLPELDEGLTAKLLLQGQRVELYEGDILWGSTP